MKNRAIALSLFCLILLAITKPLDAALMGSDNAGNYSSWGSYQGSATQPSSGTGFGSWTFANTAGGNQNQNGSFLGSSANINSGNVSWGLYANNGQTANAIAPFQGGALSAGQQLTLLMQNNGIQNGGTVGLSLRNSSQQNVLEFYFVGGQSTYTLNAYSAAGVGNAVSTGVGWTSGGLALSYSQGAGNSWSFSLRPLANNGSTVTFSSATLGNLWNSISEVRFFNANAGNGSGFDLFFNNLEVVPEPATWGLLSACGLIGICGVRTIRQKLTR